jgi:hypothetical protein
MCKLLPFVLMAALASGSTAALADDEYDELERAFQNAQQAHFADWNARTAPPASRPAGRVRTNAPASRPNAPATRPSNPVAEFRPKFMDYAKKHAGQSAAIRALGWLVTTYGQGGPNGPGKTEGLWALERLQQDHVADPALKDVLPDLQLRAYVLPRDKLIALYEAVVARNPDPEAKATALFNEGHIFYVVAQMQAFSDSGDRAADDRRGVRLFRQAAKDYPDTSGGKQAGAYIFELDRLQIGMPAPEIVGADADGQEIKLSQFRGQVVVLDFWGFW